MKISVICVRKIVLIVALLATHTSSAADSKWVVRGIPSYFSTSSEKSRTTAMLLPPFGQETVSQGTNGAPGIGASLEYRWSERLGIEGAAFLSTHDAAMLISNDLGIFSASDRTRFRTFTIGANYFFRSNSQTQWSLGGFVPLIFADGTDHVFPGLNRTESRAYDQDYGLGVKGGVDWFFSPGSPWSLSFEGRYMFLLMMESETAGDIAVDPLVLSFGIGYRF